MGSPDHPHCFRMVHVYPMWDPVVICTVAPIGAMWFKWSSSIWDPCGQHQIYPMWASGIWDPCGKPQIYPMWATGIWDPCGQPQIYPMWASGIWDPCGKPQIYSMWASGIWDPCWKPQIYPMWASGIWDACGLPRSPPLFMYGALLAQVGPSRHLHRGTHLGPMLVIAVLYLNLTYFWYLLTLGLVVTDCYLKYMYQTICEIDPCLIIEKNQCFVNVPNF